ncbi:aminotransferase class I/II-fold pyridoxal phosphate-dependent enzyme [Brevibacillus ruminantium]|uniref:Aminotransferase class I/II-fold pyridoxal phosphate-dependent enzyme n=1 Tax=Brevibacillus ruminantium TaxID=2950604 RepID=A0ABY4WFI7_9BACL|nr:aminotransferase class I/II-fold pyridoxal phosphate-dependent enzyme [Brevibacillus ruminantium]USG65504.1 aminotransferase class I/II-fold pyridoxal phosphate-dependent enzyme [Brevibacillus ruminantium]
MDTKKWRMDTSLIHTGQEPCQKTGAVVSAVVPAVAYAFTDAEAAAAVVAGEKEGIYYGRYGNPTIAALEAKIAVLENGEAALGVSSGMAAISGALLAFLKQGDHVICTRDVYGGSYKFLTSLAPRYGIAVDFADCTDLAAVEQAIRPDTRVLYLETPSNPCLTILDIERLSELAHAHGLTVIVDNTFMTPYLQKPLELGADVVVHSATKYLNGHGDVIAGFIVGKREAIQFMRKHIMGDLGQNLNAWDAFLILRGLKTLGLRMRQHCQSAEQIARYLEAHPAIERIYYPGLSSHPQHELAKRQMSGMGGIVSFEVKGGAQAAKSFINALRLAMISFSLGDPETLVQHPASMTHFSIPPEEREAFQITEGLIRLSTGLEDVSDIIEDLEQALRPLVSTVKAGS